MAGFSDDNVMMQQYYGSFPTTSKETAVSRKVGIRKVNITPVSNASGPSGERPEEMDNPYLASRERFKDKIERLEKNSASKSTSSKTLMYVAAYALAAGVAFLAYKKFKG